MRILWLSNSPLSPSGYGGQTALFASRLRDLGHEVTLAANYGVQGAILEWNGMPVYPAQGDWGNPVISTLARHVKAELVIALCDSWVMKPDKWADDLEMAIWAPVDEYPIPPAVLKALSHEKVRPIAMSLFGEEWLGLANLDPVYVPHGFDGSVFYPRDEKSRKLAREALNVPPDAFLVGMVGANRGWSMHAPRKAFPQAFDAFARFAKKHKDAYLYVHSEAAAPPPGIDLTMLAQAVGCPEDRVAFPPDEAWHLNVMDARFVAGVYSAMDVLLNPSMSEGFGIPIIEAQASGVPVIVSNHSSMPELCGAGWLVEGDPYWDGAQMAFAINPSIASIVDALESAYDEAAGLRDQAATFVAQYEADVVTEQFWVPALEKLAKPVEVPPLKEARQVRRARERRAAKI